MRQRVTAPVTLAVFGGIYSNDPALEAVLAEVARHGVDATWFLGDAGGFGPHPDRALARLRDAGIAALRGNVDDAVAHDRSDCNCGYGDPRDRAFAQRSFDYTAAHTAAEHKAWLGALPEQARLEIGGRRVLLCHGSPRRVNEFLWESTCSDAFLESLCRAHDADVVVCSHSGLPWHRALPDDRHVVNVGVVGRPPNDGFVSAVVAFVTLHESVTVAHRHVGYDPAAVASDMEREGLPAEFIETIRTGWWTTCLENLPARERARGRH